MRWLPLLLMVSLLDSAGSALADEKGHPPCEKVAARVSFGEAPGQLLAAGKDYLRQGQYCLGLQAANQAYVGAKTQAEQAQAQGMLGQAYYRMRHYPQAEQALREAIKISEGGGSGGGDLERARWMAVLGDILAGQKPPSAEAESWYARALPLAAADPGLGVGIRLGQAKLLAEEHRLARLEALRADIAALGHAEERAGHWLNLAEQARSLGQGGLKLAYEGYTQARADAGQNQRLSAEALGGLAQLYEQQGRAEEALRLNAEAIRLAQAVDAHDLLIDLLARQGGLHTALRQDAEALAAYEGAVENIEAIRLDLPVEYREGRSFFREKLSGIYMRLADLQLRRADELRTGEERAKLLRKARDTVELIKQAELEDFLGARCAVQGAKVGLETVEPRTAILYPILFDDRLELLLSSGEELVRFAQPVKAGTLAQATCELAAGLHDNKSPLDTKALGKRLYDWLIVPARPWLAEHHIETLVIVPDGVLRLIPPAALYDGQQYLIEQYALATSPGLTLSDPTPFGRQGLKSLLAGMSEPGPVVEQLSPDSKRAFLGVGARGPADAPLGCEPTPRKKTGARSFAASDADLDKPEVTRYFKEQLKLPAVKQEIASLGDQMPNTTLMNADFTVQSFERQLFKEPYAVVHIASHGLFGSHASDSFIMAYDRVIDMDGLERLLKSNKFERAPLDLLTLSACQTAEGDDRAPLGLSGIAIKARVRSVLGSLWAVNDDAASLLMDGFYRALSQPGASKAQALRQAQQRLLKDPNFAHPYFWSPFILVGNWL